MYQSCTPTWHPHTGLYKFVHNVSTNIWSLENRMDLKLGEVTSLIVFYNIAISWLHPPNGFQFNFRLRESATQELTVTCTYGTMTSMKLLKICFPTIMTASCTKSSNKQPAGLHWKRWAETQHKTTTQYYTQGLYPFSETNFQDFSMTKIDFSRAIKTHINPYSSKISM